MLSQILSQLKKKKKDSINFVVSTKFFITQPQWTDDDKYIFFQDIVKCETTFQKETFSMSDNRLIGIWDLLPKSTEAAPRITI